MDTFLNLSTYRHHGYRVLVSGKESRRIFADVPRENILFGLPMNEERYKDVIHASSAVCLVTIADNSSQASGLVPDLELMEDADLTEIGER